MIRERTLAREISVTQIPSGDRHTLPAGTKIQIHQTLGGSYTVQTDHGLFRIDGKDGDALGEVAADHKIEAPTLADGAPDPEAVWDQLRKVYDPEIPVNIVELGLSLTGTHEERYRRVVTKISAAVANYVLGNVAISGLATLAAWIVLTILGVPYALALGFVVGFFDLIPLVGATLGAIVVALATLTVDFPVATIVWVAFILIWQRFEDYVVQPLVYRRALHVNPLVTFLAVLAGAELLGLLGALIAIPTAAAIQILLQEWWSTRASVRTLPS